MQTSPVAETKGSRCTLVAKSGVRTGRNRVRALKSHHARLQNQHQNRSFGTISSPSIREHPTCLRVQKPLKSATFCYTWVIPLSFSVDNELRAGIRFC
jgi:hypothetical protein